MTPDPIDDLLTEAGDRWRASQPPAPEPDARRWHDTDRRARPVARRWSVMGAAAGVVAVLTVGVLVDRAHQTARGSTEVATVAVAVEHAGDDRGRLVVRDGSRVAASGTVLAVPGHPVRFCAPAPVAGVGRGDPAQDDIPSCQFGVDVVGVDLAALAGRQDREGTVFGDATLHGTLDGTLRGTVRDAGSFRATSGVLHVTLQGAPAPVRVEDGWVARPLPCRAPSGGWGASAGHADSGALMSYVQDQHPDRFRRPWVAYPGKDGDAGSSVLVVEVVRGDVAAERHALATRYAGNLCVVDHRGVPSLADQRALYARVDSRLRPLMLDEANGIYAAGGADDVSVDMVLLTPRLRQAFEVPELSAVTLRPWLRPAP